MIWEVNFGLVSFIKKFHSRLPNDEFTFGLILHSTCDVECLDEMKRNGIIYSRKSHSHFC